MIGLVKRLSNQLQNTANQSTADDLAGRRFHIMLTLVEVKRMISDELLAELIEAIEKIHEISQYVCCVHVNEEALSQEGQDLVWGPNFSRWLLIQEWWYSVQVEYCESSK